ncbi:MAG: hypothetical protein ACR2K0_08995 [Acidimicrobiales bacterium]
MGTLIDRRADERRLRRSSALAGLGDGLVAVALPLLATGLTRDPLAVAAVVAAQHAPWAVVAAIGPALAGDADRRTIIGLAATMRALAVAVIGMVTLSGSETMLVLGAAAVALGLGEALADGAEHEAVPVLAPSPGAGPGARLRRSGMVGLAAVGLPLGGLMYELAAGLPFLLDVGVFALAGVVALSLRGRLPGPPAGAGADRRRSRASLPAGRTMTATLVASVATGASSGVLGVLVLFALDDLGLGAPAFGLLLAGLAAAAALGALAAPTVGELVGLRLGSAGALVVSGAGYAAAGLVGDPARPYLAAVMLGAGAGAGMVAGVLLRGLLRAGAGLVSGGDDLTAFHIWVWASIPIGALIGGLGARSVGVAGILVGAGATTALAALGAVGAPTGAATGAGKKMG